MASSTLMFQFMSVRMARSCAGALRAVTSAVRMRMFGLLACCSRCNAASSGLKGPSGSDAMQVRTALVTARSAPAHVRAIRTLMDWDIEIDEAMFLGGLPKGEFLREFEPDFFFDDQTGHVESAASHVPSGHVAAGIANVLPAA